MNVEPLSDNRNAVNEHGDVVSVHDLRDIELGDFDMVDASPLERSIRDHPAARDMDEPEISRLAQELINELRQQHKGRRKARAIFAVMRNRGQLSAEDQSAIAVEAGLSANVFDIQPENVSPEEKTPTFDHGAIEPDFTDYRKAAANDRD